MVKTRLKNDSMPNKGQLLLLHARQPAPQTLRKKMEDRLSGSGHFRSGEHAAHRFAPVARGDLYGSDRTIREDVSIRFV